MGLNDSFNNICGQILTMKPRPGLYEIYNILDQDESPRLIGSDSKPIHPTAFQAQVTVPEHSPVLMAHGNFQKPMCSHCFRIGHTVDKCYKMHGYPLGHPRAKKHNSIGSTNIATAGPVHSHMEGRVDEDKENMSTEQVQAMISYLSTRLHSNGSGPNLAKRLPLL